MFILALFWSSLALLFAGLAYFSYKFRIEIPKHIAAADQVAAFQGADVKKLSPIFDHLVEFETVAFVLTATAALVTALVS